MRAQVRIGRNPARRADSTKGEAARQRAADKRRATQRRAVQLAIATTGADLRQFAGYRP